MNPSTLLFSLEVINGAWSIMSAALVWVCIRYLVHEVRARRAIIRLRWTVGMRVAVAILAMAAGNLVTRLTVFLWRAVQHGEGPISSLQSGGLLIGATIGAIGFACAIRELSDPIFGERIAATTLVLVVAFVLFEIFRVVHF